MNINDIKKDALDHNVPIVKDDTLDIILSVIKDNNYVNILELGSAVGYSACQMALLNKNIHIDTLEKNIDMYNKAVSNIRSLGLEDQINIINCPIEEFKTDKIYDFIFIDAAKSQYERYFDRFINNLSINGKVLFDNMCFHGMINDIENIKNRNTRSLVKKIVKFRENMLNKDGFDIILDDIIGDGYMIVSRRKNGL